MCVVSEVNASGLGTWKVKQPDLCIFLLTSVDFISFQ